MPRPHAVCVIRALHKLQDELARYGLGINSRKTKLLEPGFRDYSNYLAVDEDVRLQSLSDTVASHHENTIREALPLFIRAIKECDQNGNDRFLRAYGARLLEAAEFEELRVEALNAIRGFALEGFRDRPERADQWCKFLSPNVTPEVQTYICDFLDDANYNCHEWTNFWAMVTLCRAKDPIQKVTELFRRMAFGAASTPIRSHAIAAYGRISGTIDRRKLADAYLTGEISPALRRACIVGIQQLPIDIRTQYFDRAKQIDPDLTTLIDYLGSKESPTYGAYTFPTRHCTPEPEEQAPPKQMAWDLWEELGIDSLYDHVTTLTMNKRKEAVSWSFFCGTIPRRVAPSAATWRRCPGRPRLSCSNGWSVE